MSTLVLRSVEKLWQLSFSEKISKGGEILQSERERERGSELMWQNPYNRKKVPGNLINSEHIMVGLTKREIR